MTGADLVTAALMSFGQRWSNVRQGLPPDGQGASHRWFPYEKRAIDRIYLNAYAFKSVLPTHATWVTRHDHRRCHTSRVWPGAQGDCGTRFETHCSCHFAQGASCHEEAVAIGRRHCIDPTAPCIEWEPSPITELTITEQDLRDLFERHCECRPLDLWSDKGDHAAIHDCDTRILDDIQIALGIKKSNDIGRAQIREARGRCAEVINNARRLS